MPAVLLPCSCRCLVCAHALPWSCWIFTLPSAHRRWPLCHSCRAGFAKAHVRHYCAVGVWLPAQTMHGPVPSPGMCPSSKLGPSSAGRGGQCFSRWKGVGFGRGQHTSLRRVQGSPSTNRKARGCTSQDPRGCGWLVSSKVVIISAVCMALYTR